MKKNMTIKVNHQMLKSLSEIIELSGYESHSKINVIKAKIRVYLGTNTAITNEVIYDIMEKNFVSLDVFNRCCDEAVKEYRLDVAKKIAKAYVGNDEMVGGFGKFVDFKYKATTFKVGVWFAKDGGVEFYVNMGDDKNTSQAIQFKISKEDWEDCRDAICVL